MLHTRPLLPTLAVLAAALTILPNCASSAAGTATGPVRLQGGAVCDQPMSVSGMAREDGEDRVNVTATLRCGESHAAVAGAVLTSRLTRPAGAVDRAFPPTSANGTATLALDVSEFAAPPSRVYVRVLDDAGNEVDAVSIPVQ